MITIVEVTGVITIVTGVALEERSPVNPSITRTIIVLFRGEERGGSNSCVSSAMRDVSVATVGEKTAMVCG